MKEILEVEPAKDEVVRVLEEKFDMARGITLVNGVG